MIDYLSKQIPTYLGNKRSLLPFIGLGVDEVCKRLGKQNISCLDLFSGSGIVSRFLKQRASLLVSNDLEDYARVLGQCYLANTRELDLRELAITATELKERVDNEPVEDGFIRELYSPADDQDIQPGERAFYSNENAIILDSARRHLNDCPVWTQPLLLGPLIYGASVHVNTSGVFKGFYKGRDGRGKFGGEGGNALQRILGRIKVQAPVLSPVDCETVIRQLDAKDVKDVVDLAYIDPPYNQHPYGSNYFMLNLLVNYRRPKDLSKVSGIPQDWNRSAYNRKADAAQELFSCINGCNASFVLISFNSEGFITPEEMVEGLSKLGKVEVMEKEYQVFRGCRNLRNRDNKVKEFLFLLEKL